MTDLRTAAQQALKALEYAQQDRECPSTTRQAITALRAALAQQAEPVQQTRKDGHYSVAYRCKCGHEQNVTEIVQDGCIYVGSGANWCDGCGDGPPVRVGAMQQQAEPVQDHVPDAGKMVQEPVQEPITRLFGTLPVHDTQQALAQQAEPAQAQRCRAEPRSDGDYACDCKIGACPGRSAALAQQAEPVAGRAFLERILAAMEGVIDVADRKTDEFDALRSCVIDLTVMLHAAPPQQVAQQAEPQGCATEEDCTKQPWCRIRGECQRKQAEPLNLADPAVQKRLAAQWGYVPAAQAEPAQEPVAWNWMLDGQPYGQAYYGNPPDTDIAERAATAGRTVRLLYTAPPKDEPKPMHPELRKMWEGYFDKCFRAMPVPKQAEPVEPVAWYQKRGQEVFTWPHPACWGQEDKPWTPLYAAPPQRTMVPLTEEEIDKIFKHLCDTVGASCKTMARAVERAHGIKEN